LTIIGKKVKRKTMFNNPKRVFIIILLLFIISAILSLPENFNIKTKIFGSNINYTINPPNIEFNLFGLNISKKIKTYLGLDLAGGTHIALEADMKDIAEKDRVGALESAKGVIERRVNFFGVSEPVVQTARSNNQYRIIIELPGVTDTEQAIKTVGQTAKLEFREFINIPQSTISGMMIPTLVNTKATGITGKDLKKAQLSFSNQTGEPEVYIEFTPEGSQKFSDLTTRLVGKQLPIFLDNFPLTWPNIRNPITTGEGVITGGFTRDAAKALALQLNAGALPVPVSVVEKRTVGATLGQESIAKSTRAGVIGLSIVIIFMIALYGRLGFLADLALILYGLITFAIYRLIPVTLTLPGIAGFFLSVGMAVDANILIFERYKEELRKGKPWKIAMELGFGKAWDSIRDANITTIVTAIILYNPGNWQLLPSSGLVRGFAATLLIGVVAGLFTGIVVTRTLIRVLYHGVKKEKSI
jgi:preprotein translocase subunit SecD